MVLHTFVCANESLGGTLEVEWIAAMNSAHGDGGVVEYGGNLYVWSGWVGGGRTTMLEVYDRGADSWTVRQNAPGARTGMGEFELGGKIYSVGGEGP
jgi:hypothetical protein